MVWTVVAVYGVLFLDWNQIQEGSEHQPFHSVCLYILVDEAWLTICRFEAGSGA